MTTIAIADQLEALALSIFNLNLQHNTLTGSGFQFDPAAYTGIKSQDDTIDSQYYQLIAPVMLEIEGRTMLQGVKYTLNITNALQGRPKHWYIEGLYEYVPSALPPCGIGFQYLPPAGSPGLGGDWNSYGFTIGTATCAAICKLWSQIIRMHLAGQYPYAIG